MQFSLAVLSAIALAQAAYVPSEPWTTLTPSATYSGASTDHTNSFGIQIVTISTASASASAAKRDVVNQINDGQIQKQTSQTLSTPAPKPTTASVVNQIGDGQIQHQTTQTTTSKPTTASVVNQIGDGQIQHQTTQTTTTKPTTASVVNQIGDGQIQHQTTQTTTSKATTASVINQISDGQIQHQTTTTATTASVINQISDGQIQHQTSTPTTASVVNQITDGQIQHQTSTATGASQISDGQVQATGAATSEASDAFPVACSTENSLSMTLKGSELKDSKGRIGAIVANRQFQFDGPPPQAGSIYAAGWSITQDGYLAIGDNDVFYQCQSGDFYNLYDENVAAQCSPVHLEVIDFVDC